MPSSASSSLSHPTEWLELEEILRIISFQPPRPGHSLPWELWLLHTLPPKAQQLVGLPVVPLGVQEAGIPFSPSSLHPHCTKEWELRAEQEISWYQCHSSVFKNGFQPPGRLVVQMLLLSLHSHRVLGFGVCVCMSASVCNQCLQF